MTILDTVVFKWLLGIFSPLWSDSVGKIFLLTFVAYSSSYMMYSGYLSYFAKGFGGLPLSQTGFNVVDFLTLTPASFILLVEFTRSAVKYLFFYVLLPILLVLISVWVVVVFKIKNVFPGDISIASLGIILWLTGNIFQSVFFATNKKIWLYQYLRQN